MYHFQGPCVSIDAGRFLKGLLVPVDSAGPVEAAGPAGPVESGGPSSKSHNKYARAYDVLLAAAGI
jgi:hypothetical protein